MRLSDLIVRATLLAAPACCPDNSVTKVVEAARVDHAAAIDRCIANENDCLRVCSDVLDLPYDHLLYGCKLLEQRADGVTLEATYGKDEDCEMGRRPCGYQPIRDRTRSAGAWLARATNLEAASVIAFARLARSLVRIGAPAALVAATRRAIADELHHAALVAQLARDFGVEPALPHVEDAGEPTVFELACENAVAGEVGETHAALVAAFQHRLATDPRIARAFAVIAVDEARHAELAQDLAAFFATLLTPSQRAHVAALRARAVRALRHEFSVDQPALLGLPAASALAAASAFVFAPAMLRA
jgi:hypothetical protein